MSPLNQTILKLREQYHARYLELNPEATINEQDPLIIAGEWIGPGIQSGVAISKLPKKYFVIISASINGTWLTDSDYADIHAESINILNISRGGFYRRFLDTNDLETSVAALQDVANDIWTEDPFAESLGISGKGEGIVWKTVAPLPTGPEFWLKTKGPTFAVTNVSSLCKDFPSLKQNERAKLFAKAAMTEVRLEQGFDFLREMGLQQIKANSSAFLKWVSQDCEIEEKREIEEINVDMKLLKKEIAEVARQWYFRRLEVKEGATEQELGSAKLLSCLGQLTL